MTKILWLDFLLGSTTAIIGLLFLNLMSNLLGLSRHLLLFISLITLLYAIVACILATQKNVSIPLLRALVFANWFWAILSTVLLFFHFENATIFGQIFLALQIFVVGGLAYLEGNQLITTPSDKI